MSAATKVINSEHPFAGVREKLQEVIEHLSGHETMGLTHNELEALIGKEGREIQRQLLQAHLDLRASEEPTHPAEWSKEGEELSHHRKRGRDLLTIFGLVTIMRMTYQGRGKSSLNPMDAALNLPKELYSYGLRETAAIEAARGSYDATVDALARQTGNSLGKRQVEEIVVRASADFETFYVEREKPSPQASSNSLLVLSLDGKGIVMRHDSLREVTKKAANTQKHKLTQRLSKGEKKNRKRMSTVAAVYDLEPYNRKPEDIMQDLRPIRDSTDIHKPPRAQNKRVWASVEKNAEEITQEVFEEAQRRDPEHKRNWVVLVDGDRHQIARVRRMAKKYAAKITLVVDFIHVLEYLWKAAWCFFEPGDSKAEAWVKERAFIILQGNASGVAAGIRRSATLQGLEADKRQAVDDCCNYLLKKKSMLRYDSYLAQGTPIATGVIEGACRHLVKDRMDITGARWSVKGAEAILRLRSLRSSGDFEDYWDFHLNKEYQRNYDRSQNTQPTSTKKLKLIKGGASS